MQEVSGFGVHNAYCVPRNGSERPAVRGKRNAFSERGDDVHNFPVFRAEQPKLVEWPFVHVHIVIAGRVATLKTRLVTCKLLFAQGQRWPCSGNSNQLAVGRPGDGIDLLGTPRKSP